MNHVGDYLHSATAQLAAAGITTARLDCLVLLEDATQKDRSYLLAHQEMELTLTHVMELEDKIARRRRHEPLAYIRGKSAFYGREFMVNPSVLQPRPETETMIELALEMATGSRKMINGKWKMENNNRKLENGKWKMENGKWKMKNVIEVGTGSGAIAITLKLELPEATVIATDIDESCLSVARKNAKEYAAEVHFLQGNLLQPLVSTTYDLPPTILANLPYVPTNHPINESARFEPELALFGGPDGLDLYRELFTQCKNFSRQPDTVFTESLPEQHGALAQIAARHGYKQQQSKGFIQVFTAQG